MGLSHLVATGDEAPWPDCRSSRRHSLGLRDARRSDRCRPSRASQKKPRQNSKNATLDTSRLNRDFLYPEW